MAGVLSFCFREEADRSVRTLSPRPSQKHPPAFLRRSFGFRAQG